MAALLALVGALVSPAAPARADAAGLGGDFVPLATPGRLLDTRTGVGAAAGLRGGGSVTSFQALGRGGVPASGVSAVLADISVVNPTAGTYLTIWPDGSTRPPVSMLNASSGDVLSNTAVVPVGSSGLLNLGNNSGDTHLLVDVHGYYLSAPSTSTGVGGFVPVPSQRLVDTRTGTGGVPVGTIPAGGTRTVTIGNGSPVPADATSALLSLVVVGATRQSYLRAYPAGVTPSGSTMDYMAGITSVVTAVKLGTGGQISFTTSGSAIDLVVDVLGYYTSQPTQGAGLRTVPGSRIFNTIASGIPIPANGVVDIPVGGVNGLPTRGIAGAVLNLTTVNPSHSGYLRAWPAGETEPTNSLHNFPAANNRASMAVIKPGVEGKVRIRNVSSGALNLLADLQGWYADPLPSVPVAQNTPVRILQLTPQAGAAFGTVEYTFVDNLGRLRYGHQPDPNIFGTVQWSALSTNEVFTGPPALGQLSDGRVQVAAQHGDSNIRSISQTTAGNPGWDSWAQLGGSMAAPPVTGRLATGVTVLFGVDADGRLWHYRQEGTSPSWQSLGDADLTGGIAVGLAQNGLRIVAIGSDGAAKTTVYYESGSLGGWTDLGGSGLTGNPAMEVLPGFRARIVVRDGAGSVVTKYQNASGAFPTAWDTIGELTAAGSPDIILDPTYARLCVVARGTDNRVYAIWETATASGAWGVWEDTNVGTVVTDPAAAEYTSASGQAWIIAARDLNGVVRYAIRDVPPSAARGATEQPFRTGVLPKPPTDD